MGSAIRLVPRELLILSSTTNINEPILHHPQSVHDPPAHDDPKSLPSANPLLCRFAPQPSAKPATGVRRTGHNPHPDEPPC